MRTPQRFEKHNGDWWIMGVEPYTVDGVTEYALGGYETRKQAEQEWSSLRKSQHYKGEIHAVPADYSPRSYNPPAAERVSKRAWKDSADGGKKRRKPNTGKTTVVPVAQYDTPREAPLHPDEEADGVADCGGQDDDEQLPAWAGANTGLELFVGSGVDPGGITE